MMKTNDRTLLRGVSAMLLAGAAAPSLAQTTVSDGEGTGGDIVVTARRTEERLQDVPISITVYNQQQIQNRNIVTAGDLATFTPSLTANSRFGAESTNFAIRGFVQEGPTSPSVAVYFADVVAPRAQGGTTAGNGAGVGSLFDLQNVQVLKGPQGTLFGRNTTGGAVLLVPQKPTSTLGGYVEGSLGNYDLKRVQAVLNLPVADGFKVRLGVDRQKRDGFLKNVGPVGPKDFADTDYVAARLSVVADLTDNLENYTIVSYSRSDTNGFLPKLFFASPVTLNSAGVPVLNAAGQTTPIYRFANYAGQIARTPGFYEVENGVANPGQLIEQWGIINTTTFRASDTITLKNIASYQEFQQRTTTSINGDNGFDAATNSYNYAVALFALPNSHNVSQSTFTEELQLQGRSADDRLTYQAGGYYELALPLDGFQRTFSGTFVNCTDILAMRCTDVRGAQAGAQGRVGSISFSQSRYRFRNVGVYAQATYKLTDQLSLTGGIRYTSDSTFGRGRSIRIFFPQPNVTNFTCGQPFPLVQGGTSAQIQADNGRCELVRRVTNKRPTWLADIDFKPVDDVLLYGKYSRGYRQGSVNVTSYGLETWGPEKVDTYEVGAKTSFRSFVSGTLNVAAFYNDFKVQQVQVGTVPCLAAELATNPAQCPFIPGPAAGIANTASSTIKGVEVDGAVTLFRGFNVSGAYAFLDTKLKSVVAPPIPVGFRAFALPVVGGDLPLTPRHKYTVTGSYTLPLDDSIGQVTAAATFSHQTTQLTFTTSTIAQFQRLPSQDTLNLNLNWNKIAGSPIDLQLFATNVTKEKFILQTVGGGTSNGFESAILNQPRMYGARLRYTFGS